MDDPPRVQVGQPPGELPQQRARPSVPHPRGAGLHVVEQAAVDVLEHEVEPARGVGEAAAECDDVVVVEGSQDAGLSQGRLADLLRRRKVGEKE